MTVVSLGETTQRASLHLYGREAVCAVPLNSRQTVVAKHAFATHAAAAVSNIAEHAQQVSCSAVMFTPLL
jgi:hypothetical protein